MGIAKRALGHGHHISFSYFAANFPKGHAAVEWTWWRHHRNANRVFGYWSVIL